MRSVFPLVPYRNLPADIEQRYESIWVAPPNTELRDPEKVAQYYQWNLDELELVDRLGFDGVGVNEHHRNGYGFMASPNLTAAALPGAHDRRISLQTLPERPVLVDELPMTASGKVHKFRLRQLLLDAEGSDA
jgi:acyl-CoA synthetase (AMP-forming)/AMP-acid ligase II